MSATPPSLPTLLRHVLVTLAFLSALAAAEEARENAGSLPDYDDPQTGETRRDDPLQAEIYARLDTWRAQQDAENAWRPGPARQTQRGKARWGYDPEVEEDSAFRANMPEPQRATVFKVDI